MAWHSVEKWQSVLGDQVMRAGRELVPVEFLRLIKSSDLFWIREATQSQPRTSVV